MTDPNQPPPPSLDPNKPNRNEGKPSEIGGQSSYINYSMNTFGFEPRQFHPYMLPNNFSSIIYGQRRSGKTTWVSWFLYWFQCRFRELYVFSSTAFNGHYQEFAPEWHVFPRFREDILQMIIENQKAIMGVECVGGTSCAGDGQFSKQRFKTNSKSFIDKRPICIILDDVLDTIKDLRRSVALNTVFSMGRHLNMAVIVCTQYPTALPPSFRMNVDLAVIFNTHSFKVRDIVFRDYAHNLPSWKFYGALDYFTRNFQSLCVMPCTQSNDLRDLFFVSKAEDHGPFSIGRSLRQAKKETEQPLRLFSQ